MENNWTRAGLVAVVAIIVIAVGARTFYGVGLPSQVTLINRSAETVSDAQLRQDDRVTTLGSIEPGQMGSADFMAREGSLTLAVTFSSGRKLSADKVGYVSAGMSWYAWFEVTDDKVTLTNLAPRNPSSYSKR